MSSKPERKLAKKLGKAMQIMARQLGAERSQKPTEWVMVWGAGQGLGTPKINILNFLVPAPVEIRYYVDKPFFTARFEKPIHAASVKQARNGVLFHGTQTLYIDYCAKEPPPEDESLLSPFDTPYPSGLHLLKNFITEKEERELLLALFPTSEEGRRKSAIEEEGQGYEEEEGVSSITKYIPKQDTKLKQRMVRHFGYEFRYGSNDVDFENPMDEPVPQYLIPYFSRMMSYNVLRRKPEQVTMNYYAPGQGIPPHVDAHSSFEEPIVSLSLGAPVVMDFRNGDSHLSLILPPRSLLVLKDEARYLWTHAIASRRYDTIHDPSGMDLGANVVRRGVRISLTFRLLRFDRKCECPYPEMCDYQNAKLSSETAVRVESNLVHKVYEEIAQHFSSTRHRPWPGVKNFISKVAKGQTVLDVGCGNGKYFKLTDYIYEVGMDMSQSLLQIARNEKNVDGVRANCLKIPFKSGLFDAIICIAVLHHLSTEERRLDAINEIYRMLAPGGHALIYVWAKDQKMLEMKSAYARQMSLRAGKDPDENVKFCPPRDYSFLPVHNHDENFRFNDMLVPWLSGGSSSVKQMVHHRYYHVFNRGELENLIGRVQEEPPPRIVDSYYDQGNWCVEIVKDPTLPHSNLNLNPES